MAARERPDGGGRRASHALLTHALPTLALAWAAVALLAACRSAPRALSSNREPEVQRVALARPLCEREVKAGRAAQAALDAAPAGSTVCLEPGQHAGPLVLRHPLTLWGPPSAVVKSSGDGTTIDVKSSGVALLGFTVDGSGGRYDLLDAAVHVQGSDVRVEGLEIKNAVFGVLVDQSRRVRILNNLVRGTNEPAIGLRGDAIRLWETEDSVVSHNRVLAGRDVVVWYSSGNLFEHNVVTDGRYGTHFMYSHRNVVRYNRYERDVVGVFLMYSRDITLENNQFLHAEGAAGIGVGFKESGNVRVADNAFVHNTMHVFMDTSPLNPTDENTFSRNLFALGQIGVDFHASGRKNVFVDNAFQGSLEHVRVDGNGNALGVTWKNNYFDDYAGYDLDGDGFGDVPHEVRRLSGDLVRRSPEVAFLRGTPALWLTDAISSVVPLFPPTKLFFDPQPRMRALLPPTASEKLQ
ncbi:MAG: nitrous oxide reductase family maturation protein NosD [Sorangiineae bacterium]|nr:nitrous oxide reductase family maturation protein NosD [Polyangiaceae bacterium]MEB2322058.1 nitrous oxide reductase family maturation protein NosD [Sorangiineae bacterium]